MKALLTSPNVLFHYGTENPNEELIESLRELHHEGILAEIGIFSSDQGKLDLLPKKPPFYPLLSPRKSDRRKPGFIEKFIEHNKEVLSTPRDLIVLAGTESDALMCFQNKLLMLSARWLPENDDTKKVHGYGIGVDSPQAVSDFLHRFLILSENYYYSIEAVDDVTSLYSIMNANTKAHWIPEDEKNASAGIRAILKEGSDLSRTVAHYFLLSMYSKLEVLREVDLWTVYPSSGAKEYNPVLLNLKNELRLTFGFRAKEDLLIRHTSSPKRHTMRKMARAKIGCSTQFDTIIVNPKMKGKLAGKTVCIIDDYTTYGSSCETARHLLKEAGVAKIIFITIGKFGREYYKYDYTIQGSVHKDYTYKLNAAPQQLWGTIDNSSSKETSSIIGDIL